MYSHSMARTVQVLEKKPYLGEWETETLPDGCRGGVFGSKKDNGNTYYFSEYYTLHDLWLYFLGQHRLSLYHNIVFIDCGIVCKFQGRRDDRCTPSSWIGGQGTDPYEQNTQQSLSRGFSPSPHPLNHRTRYRHQSASFPYLHVRTWGRWELSVF